MNYPDQYTPEQNRPYGGDAYGELDASQQEVADLLNTVEVQAGIQTVDLELRNRIQTSEDNGVSGRIVFHGVTPQGRAVAVVEFVPRQGERRAESYDAYVYDIHEVTTKDFATNLQRRDIAKSRDYGRRVDIFMKTEDGQEYAQHKDYEKYASERLVFGKDGFEHGKPTLGGSSVETFEEAAFGHSRKAVVREQIAPLIQAQKQYERSSDRADRDASVVRNPSERLSKLAGSEDDYIAKRDAEWASAREMADRAREVIRTMESNPEMVDRPGAVHDIVKARLMADAVAPLVERAKTAKTDAQRSDFDGQIASLADRISAEYDADPLGGVELQKSTAPAHLTERSGGLMRRLRSIGKR